MSPIAARTPRAPQADRRVGGIRMTPRGDVMNAIREIDRDRTAHPA